MMGEQGLILTVNRVIMMMILHYGVLIIWVGPTKSTLVTPEFDPGLKDPAYTCLCIYIYDQIEDLVGILVDG